MRYPENARIDHDWAFAIGPTTIQSLVKNDWGPESGCLHAFRTDKESTGIEISPDNRDLSRMHKTTNNTKMLEEITESSRAIFEVIASYAEAKINRLHVAIVSELLGKIVLRKLVTLKTLQYTSIQQRDTSQTQKSITNDPTTNSARQVLSVFIKSRENFPPFFCPAI